MTDKRTEELVERAFREGFEWGDFAGGGNARAGAVEDCWKRSQSFSALEALTAREKLLTSEIERLQGLENLVSCAEEDVTPRMMRELFDLPDYSSAGRAALNEKVKP